MFHASTYCLFCTGLAFASSLFTQNEATSEQFGPPGAPIRLLPLLVNQSVQDEIKLTQDQRAKLLLLNKEFSDAVAKVRLRNEEAEFSKENQRKWLDEIDKVHDDITPRVNRLLEPEQLKRARQIGYQVQGPFAFRNPDVINTLKLTAGQKRQIELVNQDYQRKIQAIISDATLAGVAKVAKVNELLDEQTVDLAKMLTKEQAKTWTALRGNVFDISAIRDEEFSKSKRKKLPAPE
jgi:hypothetical protein